MHGGNSWQWRLVVLLLPPCRSARSLEAVGPAVRLTRKRSVCVSCMRACSRVKLIVSCCGQHLHLHGLLVL